MDDKIGFDCSQILMRCNTINELDEAMRIVNNMYRVLREHLEVIETIRSTNSDINRYCFLIGKGGNKE